MAATDSFVPNQLYDMPLADLWPDPNQPRKYLDQLALDGLTASITEHNVISPIVFRVEDGRCIIVAGERRCLAARKAGFATIPAIYSDSPRYAEISLTENTVRADLTAVEEAEALDRLQKSQAYKQEDLARIMGKTAASISQTLSLNKLPQTIRDECRQDPSVPKRVLIEIAAKKQARSMLRAYEEYKASINPEKKPNPGGTATKVQIAVKAMEAAGRKIEGLGSQALSPEDKESVVIALNALREIIAMALAANEESPFLS
jgi:ParB family chromosome partitioning protein